MENNINDIEKIKKLKELMDEKIITEEEFVEQKNKIFRNNKENNNNYVEYKENSIDGKAKKATVGFILGLCSIIAWIIPLLGFPVTIIGIVFSAGGLESSKNNEAKVGLILSIIFLVITLINSIIGAVIGTFGAL